MRPDRDQYFLSIARSAAERSTCARRRVGAVLVDHRGRILSTGYNGSPGGYAHCQELGCDIRQPCQWSVHAEINALLFAENREPRKTLYVTTAPCRSCALAIANAGVTRVVAAEQFRPEEGVSGLEVLLRGGIVVDEIAVTIPEV